MFKVLSLTISTVFASAGEWDYKKLGADWPDIPAEKLHPDATQDEIESKTKQNECGLTNQSPIDLPRDGPERVWSASDVWTKWYSNPVQETVTWNGHTSIVSLLKDQTKQQFSSQFVAKEKQGPSLWNGQQFHFHHLSEHTVDGKYMDLEMHTVHYPQASDSDNKGQYIAAAVGLMFSVNDHSPVDEGTVALIDKFFDQLQWEKTDSNPTVDLISYGDLMNAVNTNDRWVYKGSVTTPPCARFVYWNVLRTIFPIKQKHLDAFKNQMKRDKIEYNYRVTSPIDEHDLRIIDSGMRMGPPNLMVVVIILAVLLPLTCVAAIVLYRRNQTKNVAKVEDHVELKDYNTGNTDRNRDDEVDDKAR